jgi:hypothetical protein
MCLTQPFGLAVRAKTLVNLPAPKRAPLAEAAAPTRNSIARHRTNPPEAASRIVGTDFSATRFIEGPQP